MTKEQKQKWLADRARALAIVLLTRRRDLVVTDTKADTGLDFHVYIERAGMPTRPLFGVQLKATSEPVASNHSIKGLGPTRTKLPGPGKFAYPVCLLWFNMREEQAFFAWLAEPILDDAGAPKLLAHKKIDSVALTDKVLNDVVEDVVRWYETLQAALTIPG